MALLGKLLKGKTTRVITMRLPTLTFIDCG